MTHLIGTSLKMYFGHRRALRWCTEVAGIAARHQAVRDSLADLFVLPSFPALAPAVERCRDTGVAVGAQDLFWEDKGAFTGEVSGAELSEMGCRYVEVGHAERRRIFGEDEHVISGKMTAALRNGLVPVLCVGEQDAADLDDSVRQCRAQLESALSAAYESAILGPIVVAYEPQWAIGAAEPASPAFIREVCTALRQMVMTDPALTGSRVIYGGSAKPGLLTALGDAVNGLFLGRFAHESRAFEQILDEVAVLNAPQGAVS